MMAPHPSGCLHCEINALLQKRIESDVVDVTDLAAKMAESLAELVLVAADPEEQGKLLAFIIERLGGIILEKSGVTEEDSTH
jgi:hypothetical protein